MAVRFTSDFRSFNGDHVTIEIYDADFVGSSTEFITQSMSLSYDSANNDDPTSPIIGSKLKIGMVVYVDDSILTTFVEDFSTSEEGRFLIEIGNTSGPAIMWRGILTPDFTGEEDIAPHFVFSLSGICGLAMLKKKPYHDGAAIYLGIENLISHLTNALGKLVSTGLWGGSDVFLKTNVDWWSEDMDSGPTDDAMFQVGVDHATFYDYSTEGDLDKDVLSSYDVLWHILKTLELRIFQVDGLWWIEQISYRTSSSYYSRNYSKTGGYLSNTLNSGVNLINNTVTGAKITLVNYDFLPALLSASVEYQVKTRRNFLAGTSIQVGNFQTSFDQVISSNGGTAVGRLRFTINYSIKEDDSPLPATTQFFLIPKVQLKIGDNYLSRTYTISNFSAQLGPLEWAGSGTVAVPIFIGMVSFLTYKQGSVTVDLILPPLPDDGEDNDFATTVTTAEMLQWNGNAVDESDFTIGINIKDQFLNIYDQGTPAVTEDSIVYESENSNAASEKYETKVRIGSADLPNSAGRLMFFDGANWIDAGGWGQGVDARTEAVGDLLAKNILNLRHTSRRRLNGQLVGALTVKRLLSTTDGKKWMFSNLTWDMSLDTMSGTWFEIEYGGTGVNSTPIKKHLVPSNDYPTLDDAMSPGIGSSNSSPGFFFNPPPTVLAPVAYNDLDGVISEGDTVTSIPIKTASEGNEFLAGDGVTLVNPATGQFQTFIIDTPPSVGDVTLSVVSQVSIADYPEDSYLVVKQKAYAFTPGNWNTFEGVIGVVTSNRVFVTGFDLPTNDDAVIVIVRRQVYLSPDDYTVNLVDNSIDFLVSPSLNTQTAYIRAYV